MLSHIREISPPSASPSFLPSLPDSNPSLETQIHASRSKSHVNNGSPLCPTGHRPFGAAVQKGKSRSWGRLRRSVIGCRMSSAICSSSVSPKASNFSSKILFQFITQIHSVTQIHLVTKTASATTTTQRQM